jgi:hypothetical protein
MCLESILFFMCANSRMLISWLFFVLFLISVKPEYVRITKDDSTELQNASTIGPFTEGEELTLTCESGGGKPIPNVVWWNGTHKMTGKFVCIYLVWLVTVLDGCNAETVVSFWKFHHVLILWIFRK